MDDRLLNLLVDLRYALGDNGARMQGDLVEYAKQIKAKADEADALREALVLTQSRLVPLSSVVVGLHGDGMYFSIGNQYFRLAYAPTEPAEFDFMRCMLLSAFSRLVESAPAPQAHVGPDASGADSGMPGSAAERHLRRLLCLRAGMAFTYWDDGEAQGTEHGISIDFMREPVADIDAKLCALNVARAACPSSPEPDEPEGSVCARCGALAFDPVVAQHAEPDLRFANPIGLTPPQKEMQRRQLEQQAEPVQDLYWRLHSLSKVLEGSGRIDQHDHPDAYATILDAMRLAQRAEPHPDYPCRSDGLCQYAIDHGAEGLGHCPRGKCATPKGKRATARQGDPTISPHDIEANVASAYYFTAEDGYRSAMVSHINATLTGPPALGLITFCVLVLKDGLTVTGESTCVWPENFDAEAGRELARANAIAKARATIKAVEGGA